MDVSQALWRYPAYALAHMRRHKAAQVRSEEIYEEVAVLVLILILIENGEEVVQRSIVYPKSLARAVLMRQAALTTYTISRANGGDGERTLEQ